MRRIPGSKVEELTAEAAAAAETAAALDDALARERDDAEALEPKRRAAIEAHAAACAEYERIRDAVPASISEAVVSIDHLIEARARASAALRQVDRLGAVCEARMPNLLHRTVEGDRVLEAIRSRVLVAI